MTSDARSPSKVFLGLEAEVENPPLATRYGQDHQGLVSTEGLEQPSLSLS